MKTQFSVEQTRWRAAGRAVVAAVLVSLCTSSAPALQDAGKQSSSVTETDESRELAELGETLKAAVLSGALSEEDAIGIYKTMASRLWAETSGGKGKGAARSGSSKLDVFMLRAPRPEQITALFQPEFLRRNVPVLGEELDLDREQLMVAEVLLGDYLEAFDVASSPLREALRRYQRSATDQWLAAALERTRLGDVDVAIENTRAALAELAQGDEDKAAAGDAYSAAAAARDAKRAARAAWARRMVEVTANLEERLATVRERVSAELAELDRQGAITADDLVRMARQFRDVRARLRADMTETLGLITTDAQKGEANARFDAAMARIRVARLLPRGRLGGESMNLWVALEETGRTRPGRHEFSADAYATLDDSMSGIAELLDRRTGATLDRELLGLEFQAARDRIAAADGGSIFSVDQARLAGALKPFADAARREVTASVAVRDALLAMLEESGSSIEEAYPDTGMSQAYRRAALRRGFSSEMRHCWSERAIAAALRLGDLGDGARDLLLTVEAQTSTELQMLRDDAIARRIRRDPFLAREQIDARLGSEKREFQYSPEMWLGINHEAFASIDDRVASRLGAILTAEQVETLPARRHPLAKGGK